MGCRQECGRDQPGKEFPSRCFNEPPKKAKVLGELLGMPLDAHRETACRIFDGFDYLVFAPGTGNKSLAEFVDGLVVGHRHGLGVPPISCSRRESGRTSTGMRLNA